MSQVDAVEATEENEYEAEDTHDLDSVVAKWGGDGGALVVPEDESEPETDETPAEEGQKPDTSDEVQVKSPDQEAEPAPEETPRARQLAILARQQKEIQEREAQLKEREEKLSRIEQLQARVKADPVALLKELGVDDLSGLASQLWYTELGEDAPPEFRRKVQERSIKTEIEQMREQLEQVKQEAAQAQQNAALKAKADALESEMKAFAGSVPEDMPFLAKFVSKSAADAHQALAYVAASIIETEGRWPSVREVAQAIEEEMRSDWESYSPTPTEKSPSKSTPKTKRDDEQVKTLSDADTTGRPDKSLDDDDELLDDEQYQKRAEERLRKEFGLR